MSGHRPRWRLVTFDIDGTLTRGHGWRFLAERVGRVPEYESTNREYFAGKRGEDEHLADLLRLADGLTIPQLDEILAATPKIDGIAPAISTWHGEGTSVALLTHNPWYVCEWYARTFGFDGFAGTPVPPAENGRLRLHGGVHADKLLGLQELVHRFGVVPAEVVHVGDGKADARVFPHVGAGVALNADSDEVRRAATLALKMSSLRELPQAVDALP
ncbi:MAG TPA: HAD family hydrolase [Thermoplasmata archaeon]|nr:HAD family hydrolase [Thermoplasmata archaeon]